MTVNGIYSFSIHPKGMPRDFSNRQGLIDDLSIYSVSVEHIPIYPNDIGAWQKAEIKIEVETEKLDAVREILRTRGLDDQISIE
tara:strand:+ start:6021 stop:6272 length:252 start_codon:yes stop_codon:yes gene_type:complete